MGIDKPHGNHYNSIFTVSGLNPTLTERQCSARSIDAGVPITPQLWADTDDMRKANGGVRMVLPVTHNLLQLLTRFFYWEKAATLMTRFAMTEFQIQLRDSCCYYAEHSLSYVRTFSIKAPTSGMYFSWQAIRTNV